MKRPVFFVGFALVMALSAAVPAQSPAPPPFVSVTSITVKPAAVADFEDYLKKLQAAGLKIGLKVRADTYQTMQGGSPFHYDVVQGFQTLEELGAVPSVPAQLTRAYGDAEGARLMRSGRAAIEAVEFSTLQYQAGLSTKPRLTVASPFYQIVRIEIDPQMEREYTDYLQRAKAAGDKFAAAPVTLRHTSVFGPAFVYLSAQPFATWAERAKWSAPGDALAAAYGDAEATKMQDFNRRATRSRTIWVMQYRPDLSRIPGTS